MKLPFFLRFALRDLLGDPRGFGIFAACIVIGVAAISGVAGLSGTLTRGLAREGRTILGGDASFSLAYRAPSDAERAFFRGHGKLAELSLMRGMARSASGEAALVEIKAVDPESYPTFGALELEPPAPLAAALAEQDGQYGLIADPVLIARLDAKIGDVLTIGAARLQMRAALRSEPDKLAGAVGFGPRVMLSQAALAATGLVGPGAITRRLARVALPDGASDADVQRFVANANAAFPEAGWEVRRRDDVSPQFTRNLQRFSQLLTLVALTALVAGGAGVANAVQGFVERKRAHFAILKALGAPGSRVFATALAQVLMAAAFAIALGLALGVALPFAGAAALRDLAELPLDVGFDTAALAKGALYGLLITLVFALGPLSVAHETPVAALLRDDPRAARLWRYRIAAAGAALATVALLFASSSDWKLAGAYVGAVLAAFALLRGAAALTARLARAAPRVGSPRLRFALANIGRPKSLTPALVISMGVTLTLAIALAEVEGAIHAELARADSGKIPNFFFIDVPKDKVAGFETFLSGAAPGGKIEHVPMMRGRITAVKGQRIETLQVADDAKWAVEGDRGVTFSSAPAEGSQIAAGAWWPADYKGPPLVSLESKVADGIGAAVGDDITVNVLGREITAKIASLRKLDWRSYGINFVMVFNPGAFAGAPWSELFTIAIDAGDAATRDARDAALTRASAKAFPMVSAIRVKDVLEAADKIAGQLALAARAASALAVVTAILALASALASGQRARIHDAVVLKTLGATRGWLARAYALEFLALGAVATLIALACGTAAAYAMTTLLMKIDFAFPVGSVTATVSGALLAAIGIGLAGTWRALARSPGRELREL